MITDNVPNDIVREDSNEELDRNEGETNGSYHGGTNHMAPAHVGRRHQLYVGNLTWWTTDQDITEAIKDVGVHDFLEVKFFENRSNGQSKGFCVVSLGSDTSSRMVMDRLTKKELHGQIPVVTMPTKQALNQFESQQKTRPVPPQQNGPRGPAPPNMGGPMQHQGPPPGHQPRMINPNMPPGHLRSMQPNMGGQPQHMQQGPPPGQGPPRMQGPPMHQGQGPPIQQQGPPRFQNQQWNGPPRPPGPPRPGMPPQSGGPPQRPQMYQGPPGGMPRGPRPDWNRPPMHPQNFQQAPPGPPQSQLHMQGPPRGPPPQMGGPPGQPHGPPQGPAPHVNPAFFNQSGPHPNPSINPHGGPQPSIPPHGAPPHFNQQGAPRGPWPGPPGKPSNQSFPEQGITPQLSEVEFEEIMARNRTVSSSAIAR